MATLIIFIDSLRPDDGSKLPFLGSRSTCAAVEPGFGYSINLHAEMFAGKRPDDVGFFCEWHLRPELSPGKNLSPLLPLIDTICRPYIMNRGVQHLLTRRYRPGHPMPNIPLRHIDKFALVSQSIFSPHFPTPTLMSENPQLKAIKPPKGIEKSQRDQVVLALAEEALASNGNILAALPQLDSLSHHAGVGSEAYLAKIKELDKQLSHIYQVFRQKHPDGHFFVLSDHGMSNISHHINLDVEEKFGKSGLKNYMFFTDATLLRLWVLNENLQDDLQNYLANLPHSHLLTTEERIYYGLTSSDFGDFIVVLDEGVCFSPSYFARNAPNAMHGYHPHTLGHQAIFAHEGPSLSALPKTLMEVYPTLKAAIQEGVST